MEHQIVVRGEGEVRVMPDRVTIRVDVEEEGPSPEEAYSAAGRVAGAIDEVFQREAEVFERVQTTSLFVQPRTKGRKGESVRTGWSASRTSVVEVRALDRISELISLLVSAGAALSSLSWELDASHEAYDRARLKAGADARRRASLYAESLGVNLGDVAWVSEPGLRVAGGGWSSAGGAHRTRSLAAGRGEEPIDVTPEEITLEAAIEVGFDISDGRRPHMTSPREYSSAPQRQKAQ